ncbi:hypothetical protein Poli38472_007184 [Pythium oligandrum]|uniref:Uncharacterized protein n=1 Tax=Pythium oligandrum TaxID=41045 RepID=A0A8K1FFJ1_PYTOL|nr:hypothetical protein Poli38472_007184 [Pythium oligandrum]|eukprot:TMW59039.1 hypothetical protein Poli38472_007184 [Pythium oligandrum]
MVFVKKEVPLNDVELIDLTGDAVPVPRYRVQIAMAEGAKVELIEFLSDEEATEEDDSDVSMESHESQKHLCVPRTASFAGLLYEQEGAALDFIIPSSDDDSSEDTTESEGDEDASVRSRFLRRRPLLRVPQHKPSRVTTEKELLEAKILRDFNELEAKEPWKFVYRCLEIPFVSTLRSDRFGFLFERWDAFWVRHGRAVWERMYWAPLIVHSLAYTQRKNRQYKARRAFRLIAEELHGRFGTALLDNIRREAHPGWWYRPEQPVYLHTLLEKDPRVYRLHLSRYRERWPTGRRHACKSFDPLWCLLGEQIEDDNNFADSDDDQCN